MTKTKTTTAQLKSTLLGDAIKEAEESGDEHVAFLIKLVADAAKKAGFADDTPIEQVINYLGTDEHKAGNKVQ